MKIAYLEIVTPDVDGTIAVLEQSTGAKFSDPRPELGNSRLANMEGGGQVGVRAPMHDGEKPVTRTYFATDEIDTSTDVAIKAGGELAHPVMELPGTCKFSIFFKGNNEFGLWES